MSNNDDPDEIDKKRKEAGRRRGDSVWYEGSQGAFNRNPNTPHKVRVWGTCNTCHAEGWAEKTMYNDNTVYYSCERKRHKDNFIEHEPGSGPGLRAKYPDKPGKEMEGDREDQGGWMAGSTGINPDPHGRGEAKPTKEKAFCRKCKREIMADVTHHKSGFIEAYCPRCGNKIGPNDMR